MTTKLIAIFNEVRAHKGLPPLASLLADMRLREDCGFVSLDLAELTVRIEEAFEVDVFAEGIVSTVGELVARLPDNAE